MKNSKNKFKWEEIRYNLLLAITSGVIIGFAFPPFHFGIIACVGFIPILFLMENLDSYSRVFKYTYVAMLVFNAISNYWVGGWSSQVDIFLIISGVVLVFFHPLFFVVPFLCTHFIKRQLGERVAIYAFPILWVAFEFLHSMGELSYPWLMLANTQTYYIDRIQYITYTGAYGISFWIVTINVLIYVYYNKIIRGYWHFISTKSIIFISILILFIFLPDIFSKIFREDENEQYKKINISIIQPNVDPWDKWQSTNRFGQVSNLMENTIDAIRDFKTDLVVWPETGIPYYILMPGFQTELDELKKFVNTYKINLISGFADLKYYKSDEIAPPSSKKNKLTSQRYDSYNSILFMQPFQDTIQIYHKIKLVPFSERIPYLDSYPFLIDVLEWGVGISNWQIGKDSTIFSYNSDKNKFWAMVCYESIYPYFVSSFVKKGAKFLIIVTNDSWFGNSSGPYQHNQIAVLRAIENRRYIVRCANGGISSIIDPYGRIIEKTKLFTKAHLNGEIELRDDLTFYTKNGDIFATSMTHSSGLLLFICLIIKIKKRFKNE